jgi:TRAP-type mannitol/chloroaromatic compound transport system permease large subunit
MKDEILPAVPLFIFMGYMTEQAGLMERLFGALRSLLAPVRGALYLAVILTATIFAMATGIVGAAVTVLGIMAGPMMIKSGYDGRLSAGAIAAGGTLGVLIPPSVMLVVMGPTMGVPVNLLYSAAFGPGFVLAGCYMIYTLGRSFLNPKLGPAMTMEERKVAYDFMTTEKVGIAVIGLGLLCVIVIAALLVYAVVAGVVPKVPTLGWGVPAAAAAAFAGYFYIRSAYFRAIMLGIAPLSALIGFTLGTILAGLARLPRAVHSARRSLPCSMADLTSRPSRTLVSERTRRRPWFCSWLSPRTCSVPCSRSLARPASSPTHLLHCRSAIFGSSP